MLGFLKRPAVPGVASVAPDTVVYAIGDVHGRDDLLEETLDWIVADFADAKPATGTVVVLGDVIDRGPASAQVIARLRTFRSPGLELVPIKGNHESTFLMFLGSPDTELVGWMARQTQATLASYGLKVLDEDLLHPIGLRDRLITAMGHDDVAFLRSFQQWHASGDYVFVHAGLDRGKPHDEQDPVVTTWGTNGGRVKGRYGKVVVHGHYVTPEPETSGSFVSIDTGAYRTGRLTVARIEGSSIDFRVTPEAT